MGCRNDYLEQNDFEKENQTVAKFLVWLSSKNDTLMDISLEVKNDINLQKDSQDYYCKTDRTADLCKLCRVIDQNEDVADIILYNGRDAMSRKLAEWWEIHKILDQKRQEDEKEILIDKVQELLKSYTEKEIDRAIQTIRTRALCAELRLKANSFRKK